jgi:PTS system cellobiose-specific IIA component
LDEKQLQRAMELIAVAGNARSLAVTAMDQAEKGDIAAAKDSLAEAKKSLHEAHNTQTAWMTAEMNGEHIEKTLLLIHSQDHFMAADILIQVAQRYIGLAEKLEKSLKDNDSESTQS